MQDKLISIAKGAAIAAGAAALAYLMQWATSTDLGIYGPLVVAALSVAINALRKLGPDAAEKAGQLWRGEQQ